jgi:steroid delta-isomerase-like uncharacterized protein
VSKILTFYADDCLFEDLPTHCVAHGKKELEGLIKSMFVDFPNIKFDFKSAFGSHAGVGVEWIMTGTQVHSTIPGLPATGKDFAVPGASIMELHNRKVKRETEYWDFTLVLQQLGLMPATPK